LVEQFDDPISPASERITFFYSLLFPSKWEMQRELGDRFASFGAYRSSLEIYERWELWESAITCHLSMDKKKQAEEIVRKQLEIRETPKLWCLLGDVTGDTTNYTRAWEVSGHRFARAMRSLGGYHFKRNEVSPLSLIYSKKIP